MDDQTKIDDHLRKIVRVQQVLIGSLVVASLGMVVLYAVLHFVFFHGKALAPDLPAVGGLPVLTILGVVVACVSAAGAFFVSDSVRRTAVAGLAAADAPPPAFGLRSLPRAWQTANLLRAGLFEGPVMASLTLFLVGGDVVLLGLAVVMLGLVASCFPSEAPARRWLDAAEVELEQARRRG